jgi:RNA polymerase sigma-70 factor (ECF subfamily)
MSFVRKNDEGELIRRARQRDADAFTELYRRHIDRIFRYVLLRVADESTAEDITSDVFVRALEALDTYEDRGAPFAAWLYRIANARVIDHWRRTRRAHVSLETSGIDASVDEPARDVLMYKTLAESLARLTNEQQEVIILKFVEGYSITEIARITGRTEGAVKSLQHRALAALARLMEPRIPRALILNWILTACWSFA